MSLYGVLAFGCIASFVYSIRQKRETNFAIQQVFHLFLSLFIAVRITWFALRSFSERDGLSFILNRFGFLLFFTAFTVVLFYWAETYHKTYISNVGFLPTLVKFFVITNGLLYALEVTLVVLFIISTDRNNYYEEGNIFYESSILFEVGVNFLVSLCYFTYGARLFLSHGKASEFEENFARKTKELLKTLISTIILTVCFLVRVIAFLYRPITNAYMDDQLFRVLAYFIPEIIPSIILFYLMQAHKYKQRSENKFIEGLYKQEEEIQNEDSVDNINVSSGTKMVYPTLEKAHLLE